MTVVVAVDEECGRPIGGTELLFEREFVEVDRVARNINQYNHNQR